MGNVDTIRDFLVSLGFNVDEAGKRKFQSVLTGVTANVLKLGATVEATALSVVGFTTKISAGLERLYWASQRTGATVAGIKTLGYAAAQTGSSAEAAQSALENLSRFLRNSPGAEGFLNRLGVQTRDASGNMRDMASIFTGVGQRLSSMPYYRANQYAQMLGIDENTLMAMRRGLAGFTADYQSMLRAMGYDAEKAAAQSNKFMTSMRGLTSLFGILRDKIGSNLAGGLAGTLENLRKKILDNFPKIEELLTRAIQGIIRAGEAVTRIVWRLMQAAGEIFDWWNSLDDQSKKLITTFGAFTAAVWALNRAFFSSPIGIITGLVAALLLLYDDYQTWKEGGKSFIDWSKWQTEIAQAKQAFIWLRDKLSGLVDAVGGWKNSLSILATFIAGAWVAKVLGAFGKIAGLPIPPWLKLWGLYAGYLVSDRENISASAKSSLSYAKRNIGDALRWMGIDTDYGRKNTVQGTPDAALDIPGNQSELYAKQVRRPRPSRAGVELLGWLQPTLSSLERLYRLPEGLLRSVAIAESSGNQFAVSGAGAKGLFQFMDGTARDMGLRGNDVFDPVKSAQAAARYLSQLLKVNGGDLERALASYNWGLGNVRKHGMALMPQETRNYIPRVLSNMPGAGGSGIQQETTINVYGATDPVATGMDIAGRQTGVNARLIGQLTQRAY
ncbi:transglycosylase SLT domain-containing protein [Mixta intestinalis]|uniref:Membrane-bound lytic murein transglycosylase D n=1 Tax=Mixta intestinalis TaxID=1615494 RepID=A0A6P1PZ35_9GAMM|nr:Membrane-bound lytic murein transglycosylase D [Mixta intestinalis]